MAPARLLRLATRASPLALAQVELVAAGLAAATSGRVLVEPFPIETHADLHTLPVHTIGGRGVFVTEVEKAVLDGRADAAVHSAKDVPSSPGMTSLEIAAVLEREDARDCLVGASLAGLRPGALVATGSVRRRAQLAWLRPDLTFGELRGNIGTRLGKLPEGGAIVAAFAALKRLAMAARADQVLSTTELLPQVGQGAILVACRSGDEETLDLLRPVDHAGSARAIACERAFLARVGGGCDLPVGAYARYLSGGRLSLEAMVASFDGHVLVRGALEGSAGDARELGEALAGHLLEQRGAAALLGRAASSGAAP